MTWEPVTVVAHRVATLPVPHVPSVRGACSSSSCRQPVWLSRASERDLKMRPGSTVLCEVCAVDAMLRAEADDHLEVGVTAGTRAELEAYRRGEV